MLGEVCRGLNVLEGVCRVLKGLRDNRFVEAKSPWRCLQETKRP